jgi:hypothetical protein
MDFRLRPPRLKENDVEFAVLDLLRWHHYRPQRCQSGRFQTSGKDKRWITIGEPGLPDYVIPRFFVEVKRPGGLLSEVQKNKIFELERAGIPVAIVESAEAMSAWLKRYEEYQG